MNKNYWGYRINKNNIDFFTQELHQGRLRQGWGYDERQNLRNMTLDEGAGRNLSMYNKVKKGDLLLIPHLPKWGVVAIVEATDDWFTHYEFSIDSELGDYGHVFPAKFLKSFSRQNAVVSGNIRSTLKNPSRFWNISHYSLDIEKVLSEKDLELHIKQDYRSRFESAIGEAFNIAFDGNKFKKVIYDIFNKQFTREEWEYALVSGLEVMLPFYSIDRVGGITEKEHGTDILIKLPTFVEGYEYAIAIQVKDYSGVVGNEVVGQINKASNYWENQNLKLIDKWIIITRAKKEVNLKLIDEDKSVKIIFAEELGELLNNMGRCYLGLS
ncbi:MAG: hypothetical protein JXR10_06885 [Cyclobacteriaceae bacterium]